MLTLKSIEECQNKIDDLQREKEERTKAFHARMNKYSELEVALREGFDSADTDKIKDTLNKMMAVYDTSLH